MKSEIKKYIIFVMTIKYSEYEYFNLKMAVNKIYNIQSLIFSHTGNTPCQY